MQTITDFIVKVNEEYIFVSHRDNNEHIVEGASSTLVYEGIGLTKTTKQLSAWIGDTIDVLDYYGSKLCSGVVVGKSVREWDMSKPIGKRLVSENKSKRFNEYLDYYNKTVKQKRGY